MNRLLSKLRHGEEKANGASTRHVRLIRTDRRMVTARPAYVLTAAETAQCTCPDFCERDHANE